MMAISRPNRTSWMVGLVLLAVVLSALSCERGSPARTADELQLRRIDGTSIQAGELEKYIEAVMDSAGVTGLQLAIINEGRVVYTREFGLKSRRAGTRPDSATVFAGCSFSKPVFAHLVMQLAEEGILDVDRPLAGYLKSPLEDYPQWSDVKDDRRTHEITARHVLTHTTGWPNLRLMSEDGKLTFIYPPGERFSYSGEGFSFLQLVVEDLAGKPLDELAREMIFIPLGMSRTGYVWRGDFEANHADGHAEDQRRVKMRRRLEPGAGGSLTTTASDFAVFVASVLRGEILSRDAVYRMLEAQVPIHSSRMFGPGAKLTTDEPRPDRLSWSLGWGTFRSEYGPAFFHTGHDIGWENYTVTYLDGKTGIVLISNSSNFESVAQRIVKNAIGDLYSPFEWLGYEPFDPSIPPPPPAPEPETVPVDAAIFDEAVGEYDAGQAGSILIEVRDGRLVGSGDGAYWDDVLGVSETEFLIDGKPWVFSFTRDSAGTVTGIVIDYEGLKIPAEKVKPAGSGAGGGTGDTGI